MEKNNKRNTRKNNSNNRRRDDRKDHEFNKDNWTPKTKLGKLVKDGEVKNIDFILDNGMRILEPEIIDVLIPNIETELLLIGQSKGKFGGGQRRVFKQTQKKTREGNKPHFSTFAVVGNKNGYVGVGTGKSKETVPAREKAFRNAKLNLIKIGRGNGSWEDPTKTPNSIPFKVNGKCGSVKITLMPAPKGTGLKVEKECQKILTLAGIKDVWSRTSGQTKSKNNLIWACEKALRQLMETKVSQKGIENTGLVEGKIKEDIVEVESVVEPEEKKNE
jgi:small subunit ribosomal protein S5